MSNVAGAPAQAKASAYTVSDVEDIRHTIEDLGNSVGEMATSDVEDIRHTIEDLGNSVGEMATSQYERAHDAVTDGFRQTGDAIQRNPLTAIGIGLGLGFLFGLVTGGRSNPASRRPL